MKRVRGIDRHRLKVVSGLVPLLVLAAACGGGESTSTTSGVALADSGERSTQTTNQDPPAEPSDHSDSIQPGGPGKESDPVDAQGLWSVESLRVDGGEVAVVLNENDKSPPSMFIAGDQISLFLGCNDGGGSVTLDDSQRLELMVGGTDMLCSGPRDDFELAYSRALDAVTRWSVDGNRLRFTTDDGETEIVYLAREIPTINERWSLIEFFDADGRAVTLPNDRISISIDGTTVDASGCNTGSGSIALDRGSVAISFESTTEASCPGDAGRFDDDYFTSLESIDRWSVDLQAESLSLTNSSDDLELTFERSAK